MDLVRLGDGKSVPETLPLGCDGRPLGRRGPELDADEAGGLPTPPRPARGVQRPALNRAHRRRMAPPADERSALGSGLPAIPALDRGGVFRRHGPRAAGDAALDRGPCRRPHGGHPRQPHGAEHPGERRTRGLRRAQEAQRQQDPPRRRHAEAPAGPADHPGECPGPGPVYVVSRGPSVGLGDNPPGFSVAEFEGA